MYIYYFSNNSIASIGDLSAPSFTKMVKNPNRYNKDNCRFVHIYKRDVYDQEKYICTQSLS